MKQIILAIAILLTITGAVKPVQAKYVVPSQPQIASTSSNGNNLYILLMIIAGSGAIVGIAYIIRRSATKPPKTIDLLSNSPDSNSYIKSAYTRFQQGDTQGAMAEFTVATTTDPQNADTYIERANFRKHYLNDNFGAIEDYTYAISINPHNSLFYMWRSQTYRAIGEQQKAVADHNQAMRIAPDETIYHCFSASSSKD
jgi:Tfp pilus assembly protein PilF